jgi:hypothetical protein
LKKKLSFYCNIFLSQYLFIAILCAKMSRVNKALVSRKLCFHCNWKKKVLSESKKRLLY